MMHALIGVFIETLYAALGFAMLVGVSAVMVWLHERGRRTP